MERSRPTHTHHQTCSTTPQKHFQTYKWHRHTHEPTHPRHATMHTTHASFYWPHTPLLYPRPTTKFPNFQTDTGYPTNLREFTYPIPVSRRLTSSISTYDILPTDYPSQHLYVPAPLCHARLVALCSTRHHLQCYTCHFDELSTDPFATGGIDSSWSLHVRLADPVTCDS